MHYWNIKENPDHEDSGLGKIEEIYQISTNNNIIAATIVDYSEKTYVVYFSERISPEQNDRLKQQEGANYNGNLTINGKSVKGYVLRKSIFKSEKLIVDVLNQIVFNENTVTKSNPTEKTKTDDTSVKQDLKELIQSLGLDFGIDEVKVTKIVKEEMAKMPNAAPQKIVYELPYAVTMPTDAGETPNFQKIVDDIILGNNVYLVGGAGTGKTYLTQQVANALGRQMETINCSQWTAPTEIIGGQTLDGYQEGKMIEAYRRGNLLLLDEMPKLEPNTAGLFNEALAKTGDKLIFGNKETDFKDIRSILIKTISEIETDKIITAALKKEKSCEMLYLEIENAVLLSFSVTSVKDLTAAQKTQFFNKIDELMIQIFRYPIIQNNRKERFVKHPYFCCVATGNIYPNTTSSAYGANNKQDLSLLDRFAGSVFSIEKNTDLEQKLVGIRWLWSVWDDIRDVIEKEKWESQVSIRVMQASLRAYNQEMDRKGKKDALLNNGKTLKDVIYSFITSGFSAEQTKKMKDKIEWSESIEKYQYRQF